MGGPNQHTQNDGPEEVEAVLREAAPADGAVRRRTLSSAGFPAQKLTDTGPSHSVVEPALQTS